LERGAARAKMKGRGVSGEVGDFVGEEVLMMGDSIQYARLLCYSE
jgi:hypothetical protein